MPIPSFQKKTIAEIVPPVNLLTLFSAIGDWRMANGTSVEHWLPERSLLASNMSQTMNAIDPPTTLSLVTEGRRLVGKCLPCRYRTRQGQIDRYLRRNVPNYLLLYHTKIASLKRIVFRDLTMLHIGYSYIR